jgi:hypothetical protein
MDNTTVEDGGDRLVVRRRCHDVTPRCESKFDVP